MGDCEKTAIDDVQNNVTTSVARMNLSTWIPFRIQYRHPGRNFAHDQRQKAKRGMRPLRAKMPAQEMANSPTSPVPHPFRSLIAE
jgi:hypothetical protein